jgi:hypothetical protein
LVESGLFRISRKLYSEIGVIEQPQMGQLPIERPVARIAVDAHRHGLVVVHRRGDPPRSKTVVSGWSRGCSRR